MKTEEVLAAIKTLMNKSTSVTDAADSMKFAQAALNLGNLVAVLKNNT